MNETILQFGTGRFLRCFIGIFAQELNDGPNPIGPIVAVQSTGADRAEQINARDGLLRGAIRGLVEGRPVDRIVEIRSIARAIAARQQWDALLDVARSASLRYVVSNTTEAGLSLAPEDATPSGIPVSYPAKLLAVLASRHESGLEGVTVLPCELVERNAERLRDLCELTERIG